MRGIPIFPLLLPALLSAQVRSIGVRPANATLPFEFSGISSLQELSNGRLLITDRVENKLFLADPGTGRVTSIGQRGDGPGEFQQTFPVSSIGRDSMLMSNSVARRYILIDRDGKTTTVALPSPTIRDGYIINYDHRGHVLAITHNVRTTAGPNVPDSGLVLLVTRATGRVDTVARVHQRAQMRFTAAEIDRKEERLDRFTGAQDHAILTSDGWIALIRLSPYRVDWRSPDGQWTRGPDVAEAPVKVTDAEKAGFAERAAPRAPSTKMGGPGSVAVVGPAPTVIRTWPEFLPAFEARSEMILPTRHGQVAVQRTPSLAFPAPRYDIFDRRGTRIGQVTLRTGQRILGFGAESVYLLTTDDDDIQRVSRHPWP